MTIFVDLDDLDQLVATGDQIRNELESEAGWHPLLREWSMASKPIRALILEGKETDEG